MINNSRLTDKVQEIIPKAGSAFIVISEERRITKVINQLITGHTNLNYMIAKIDNTNCELGDTCKVKESISHYLYDCKIYEEDSSDFIWDIGKLPFPTHLGKYFLKLGK